MLRFFLLFQKKFFHHSSFIIYHLSAASQRGMSSVYIIIFVIILTFAIMLSGGGGSLFTGNIASPVSPTPTTDPTAPTAGPTGSTITPSSSGVWNITGVFKGCNIDGFPKADIFSEGPTNGYIKLSVEDAGGYKQIATASFLAPRSTNKATLLKSLNFSTKPWRVELYSGGSISGESWSGGTLQKAYIGAPTGC
ncbi:MAG: hypothetical protein Q7T54_05890 [Candidatus Levybacteria bacterium]|nr:hypothetical protein [Candidatus Levybacteria bacterium]